jgi:hypothetical protein
LCREYQVDAIESNIEEECSVIPAQIVDLGSTNRGHSYGS